MRARESESNLSNVLVSLENICLEGRMQGGQFPEILATSFQKINNKKTFADLVFLLLLSVHSVRLYLICVKLFVVWL